MKVVGEDQVLISKEELDALFMITNDKCCEGNDNFIKEFKTNQAIDMSTKMEEFIWGNQKLSEEVLLQTINFIRREEGKDADRIRGQA